LALLIRLIIAFLLSDGLSQRGYAPRYNPGVMQRVSRIRHMPIVPCMISSPTLPLGTMVTVYGENTFVSLDCRVTDVSAVKDKQRHIRTKRIIELDYESAIVICGQKHLNHRPEQCPVVIFWHASKE
jgi:hypothetical protein